MQLTKTTSNFNTWMNYCGDSQLVKLQTYLAKSRVSTWHQVLFMMINLIVLKALFYSNKHRLHKKHVARS